MKHNCSPYAVIALSQVSSCTSHVHYVALFLTLTAYCGSYTRSAHNSSVVALLKKTPYVVHLHRVAFFINTPSYNRDHLEYIHKSSTYEHSKYISEELQ